MTETRPGTGYEFEYIVQAVGNAATEQLLRGEPGLTFSTTARNFWVARVEAAARRMIEEERVTDNDIASAEAAAQQVLRFAARQAREEGRDEVIEADIGAAMSAIRIWPFS
jgi:hypothetical protein